VKARNIKKNRIIMEPEEHPGKINYNSVRSTEEQFINSGMLYSQAIENANGVPFQLIFGPLPGEGYFLNVGLGIRQLLGISSGEFTEKMFTGMIDEIVPLTGDIPSDLSEARRKIINAERKSYKAEILVGVVGGEKKWIQYSSLPLVDEETGKVIGVFGILFDINERKKLLSYLEHEKERAEASDRLKSAFLRNISHEIRTPLNAIVGFSALLTETENGSDEQQEYKDIIIGSTDHLLEIINDIVEISDIEAANVKIKKEEVGLNKLFVRVYERFRKTAVEKNISLRCVRESDDDDIRVFTDGFKLSQVLDKLIGNAMKFTREGKVEFGYKVSENKVEIYVSDTGLGIQEEHQANIFNRFYQAESSTTRNYPGTGLGLSISKAYIEMLGGEIWFSSQPGKGSVFYFTVPFGKTKEPINS
jgi:signal transduction histidine kinase